MDPKPRATTPATEANIQTVVRLEEESSEQRTRSDRIGDAIAAFAGSITFVILHVVWFAAWIAINSGMLGIRPFDPYPFIFLSMMVSLEAVLLSTFVLMKQNRMSRRAEQRDHLNLQIDLLAEKEITKMLQLQLMLCDHFGLTHAAQDHEAAQLSADTAVEALARDLREKLPAN
jgi:uncharacterized membrane protein